MGEGLVAGRVLVAGGAGVEQQLQRQWPAGVARGDGRDRGQRAARAVATDGDFCTVQAQRGRVFPQPGQRVPGVVHGGGELPFGRQPVVQRHHRALGEMGQVAAQGFVRGDVADGEAAAVEVQQHRQRVVRRRSEQPGLERMAVARRKAQVLHAMQLVGRDVEHTCASFIGQPGLRRRQRVHGHMPGAGDAVDHAAHRGGQQGSGVGVVGRHGPALWLSFGRPADRCATLVSLPCARIVFAIPLNERDTPWRRSCTSPTS